MNNYGLGHAIRYNRKKTQINGRPMTMLDLSKQIGVKESYISHIENNRRIPKKETLIKLFQCFDDPTILLCYVDIKLDEVLSMYDEIKNFAKKNKVNIGSTKISKLLQKKLAIEGEILNEYNENLNKSVKKSSYRKNPKKK